MQVNPYLHFPGTCAEAFAFYETAIGAKPGTKMTYKDAPPEMAGQIPPELQDKVMHARIDIGGTTVMGADAAMNRYEAPAGFWISLSPASIADAERMFSALAEGGKTTMPLQKTFWASRFGICTDRFGTPWMINCEAEG